MTTIPDTHQVFFQLTRGETDLLMDYVWSHDLRDFDGRLLSLHKACSSLVKSWVSDYRTSLALKPASTEGTLDKSQNNNFTEDVPDKPSNTQSTENTDVNPNIKEEDKE